MIRTIRQMITCHWSARRIQRYLDGDPAAPLTDDEQARLEEHLAICARCHEVARQHRLLRRSLAGRLPMRSDDAALQRLRGVLDDLADGRRT